MFLADSRFILVVRNLVNMDGSSGYSPDRHIFSLLEECTTRVDVTNVKLAPTMDLALLSDVSGGLAVHHLAK